MRLKTAQRQPAGTFYFFFVSPWPGFGIRSTTCVLARSRAFFTVVKCPVLASRPLGEVLGPLAIETSV